MSQADLVSKLRNAPQANLRWDDVHPTTISRIEKGERQVRFSEAFLIASALGSDPVEMTYAPQRNDFVARLDKAVERIAESYTTIGYSIWELANARHSLRNLLDRARKFVERWQADEDDKQYLIGKIDEAETYLSLNVEKAVASGRAAVLDGRVLSRTDFDKIFGVTAHEWFPDFIDEKDFDAPDA